MTDSLADDLRKAFSIIGPVGGWPEGYETWTEEEQDDYYSAHSLLNVKMPPLTREQFNKRIDEMQETSDRVMEWLESA